MALNPMNPEAGSVPVAEDPREVDAALRAGLASYRLFPYYAFRYGERGERFTRSDSVWLARLSRYDPGHIRNQVGWLASVLSNRGMPSYLLEVHLRLLDRRLTRAVPERHDQYARLSAAADELGDARRSRLADPDFEALPDAFAGRLGPGPRPLLRCAGLLVVAAVADERGGVSRSVDRLMEWLADVPTLRACPSLREAISPAHRDTLDSGEFASRWPAALHALLAEARSRPVPGPG